MFSNLHHFIDKLGFIQFFSITSITSSTISRGCYFDPILSDDIFCHPYSSLAAVCATLRGGAEARVGDSRVALQRRSSVIEPGGLGGGV